jgi:hypothetical protein
MVMGCGMGVMWDGCDVPYALRTTVRAGIDDDAHGLMRVLVVMRHGVEFEAGRGDGVEIIQYVMSTCARLRRARCGTYTRYVLYSTFYVRTIQCSAVEKWPTQHHHHDVPKSRRGLSEGKFLGGW